MRFLLFIFIVLLCFILASCNGDFYLLEHQSDNRLPTNEENTDTYVVNRRTGVFHDPSCYHATHSIDTKEICNFDFLIKMGFLPCKKCLK